MATLTTVRITESVPLSEANSSGARRYRARLIESNVWGSSGYYSAEVLEAAATDRVFAAGVPIFIDHPGQEERRDRPERSVRDLGGRLLTDAVSEADGLYAEIEVYPHVAPMIEAMADAIGMSIRASAEVEQGEADGRRGTIVSRFHEATSVDFVTAAGAGGKLVSLLESARTTALSEARNIGQWIESRIHRDFTITADDMAGDGHLTREERITLSGAIGDALAAFVTRLEADAPALYQRDLWDDPQDTIAVALESGPHRRLAEATNSEQSAALSSLVKDAHGADDVWVWLRDFDDTTVWFDVESGDSPGTYAQTYTTDGDVAAALTGEPTEVRPVTTYVPVTPAGRITEESEEDTMPEIEEARLRQLETDAGRVTVLESERDEAVTARDAAVEEANGLRTQVRQARIDTIIAEADADFDDLQAAGLRAAAPVNDEGVLDEAAFTATVNEAAATVREARGDGTVTGFGHTVRKPSTAEAELREANDKQRAAMFGRPIKEA